MPGVARLDAELVRRGLARSRQRAADLIAAGRVEVGGAVATKPAQPVGPDMSVEVRGGDRTEYVSRAAHKLVGALDAVELLRPGAVVVSGKRCLDAGASTGGFTQVLLERGATHVVAVDVGHGQMVDVVASDPRVTALEGVNVRGLTTEATGGPVDLVVADLSFISLTVALPALLGVATRGADLLLMVKPQFEVGRDRVGSSGVVTSPELREEAVTHVAEAAGSLGAVVRAVLPSPLPGPSGNHEYFLWLRPGHGGVRGGAVDGAAGVDAALHAAVRAAVRDGRAALVHDPLPDDSPSEDSPSDGAADAADVSVAPMGAHEAGEGSRA